MDELLTPAGIITLIGVIATGICTVLVIDRKTMREGMDDLRKRVEDLEGERDDWRTKYHDEHKAHDVTKQDLATMTKTVTGEVHWVAIEQLIRDVIERLKATVDKLDLILQRTKGQP